MIGLLETTTGLGHGDLPGSRSARPSRPGTGPLVARRARHGTHAGQGAKLALLGLLLLAPLTAGQAPPARLLPPPQDPPPAADAAPSEPAPTDEGAPDASAQVDAATADAPAAPGLAAPSERARRFHDALARLHVQENRAQRFEIEGLGAALPKNLQGERLKRWQRIHADKKEYRNRLNGLSKTPLTLPVPGAGTRELSALESTVLARLGVALEASREPGRVKVVESGVEEFLKTENWTARDAAVMARDALLEQERSWRRLAEQAVQIVTMGLPDEVLQAMQATLDQLSPETAVAEAGLVTRLSTDAALQAQVLGELNALLSAPVESTVPTETDAELLARLPGLQKALLDACQLTEVELRRRQIEVELAEVEAALADRGVNVATPAQRAELSGRRVDLIVEGNLLTNQWNSTVPEPVLTAELLATQDALIRRRMFELGSRAALFGHRYDVLAQKSHTANKAPMLTWAFLADQAALISELDGARPAPNPLAGLQVPRLPNDPLSAEPLPKPKPPAKGKAKGKGKAGGGKPAAGGGGGGGGGGDGRP